MRLVFAALIGLALVGTLSVRGSAREDGEQGACQRHVRPICPVLQEALCACTGPKQSDCQWLCVGR